MDSSDSTRPRVKDLRVDPGRVLEQVFQHVGEGICIFDAQGALQAANAHLAGLLSLPAALLVPGTPMASWLRHLAAAGHYGAVDIEAEVARRLAELKRPVRSVAIRPLPDGRSIETRRTPLPEGGFVMVIVDISVRLASEAVLFENQRILEVLLQQTEEGFWFIDNAACTADANPAMCRLLGVIREHLIGRPVWDFVDADNAAVLRTELARREQGQAGAYELTLTRADGSSVVCINNATPIHDAQGRKIGAIGLFSDVTAERRSQAAVRQAMAVAAEKSHMLEVTLDSLAQGVFGFDADLRLHSWNRRAIELLELPPTLLEARPTLMEIGRWQQAQGDFGHDLELIEGAGVRERVRRHIGHRPAADDQPQTYRRRRQDGRVIEVATHPGRDGGQVRTFTDVTAEVQTAQALVAAKNEAERANQAKSDFLSRMSHELRTPLNAILGFGQLMQRDAAWPLPPTQRARLHQILLGGQHLLTLINEVLDLARIETGALQMVSVNVDADALADECLRLVEPMARERPVALHPRDGHAGHVSADPTRLRQILLNLLANAIKYNRQDGEVCLRCAVTGPRVRIEVIDTGPGLDLEQQQRLFRPFERLDADRDAIEGTGIGLSLSRALVEQMGGRIGVDSAPDRGSCFWIELPGVATEGETERAEDARAQAIDPGTAPRRVLYIEDNLVNQLVMQGMLAHRPAIELQLAATPAEGLAMAVAAAPDLVLLDIQLPGASGYDVLRALRADGRTQSVPAVAVSANAMPQDLAQAREAGFDAYLTKPLDLQGLLATVDHWLAGPGR